MHDAATRVPEPKDGSSAPVWTVEAARARILAACPAPTAIERVAWHAAAGRVLAVDAVADLPQPAFDRAMMDGIALNAADVTGPGTVLRCIGEARAGAPLESTVAAGTCVRVMTGGVVPTGCDAVVPVEQMTRLDNDLLGGAVRVDAAVRAEQHIARRGSEVTAGAPIALAGRRLDAARIGALAAFGHADVPVFARPRVGLLPTGDELVAVDAAPGPGQVRDSNRWMLAAALQSWGAEVEHGHGAWDARAPLRAAIEALISANDVVVLSGGVSMGDYDLVGVVLRDLGAQVLLHRIRMRPGKPVLAATLAGRLVVGLPGNPVSSMIGAMLFVRPALARLAGAEASGWQWLRLPTTAALRANGDRELFQPARWQPLPASAAVTPLATAGSADLAHFSWGNAIIRRDVDASAVAAGELVDVLHWVEG